MDDNLFSHIGGPVGAALISFASTFAVMRQKQLQQSEKIDKLEKRVERLESQDVQMATLTTKMDMMVKEMDLMRERQHDLGNKMASLDTFLREEMRSLVHRDH